MQYDPKAIEKKWQEIWEKKGLFKTQVDRTKPKYYILDMFPYPSGAGLHVGHVTGYTGTDILARYMRQKGFNVLHPMGWDSFGLPAEQYAIRTGTHPKITTEQNIATYRRQLKSLGFSYDWSREIATSDPSYYKWTQWIFTKLFEQGLAYEAEILVNFCPHLGTVLANEEVENGRSTEGGYPVERRPLKQWVLKITAYADRLLEDLDLLDWPEALKKAQTHWIGKSQGATVAFAIEGQNSPLLVFTTRPDTLLGVTYLVLAPEHPLAEEIVSDDDRPLLAEYKKRTSAKSDLERTDLADEKSGLFLGAYAYHPITGKKIPVWVADYVLMGYATGAVMGVPAHDERDALFGAKYHLPSIPVEEEGVYLPTNIDGFCLAGCNLPQAKEKAISWLEERGRGERTTHYKLRDWLFSRQRYWGEPIPILHFADGTKRALQLDELPLTPPSIEDFRPSSEGKSPLAKVPSWVEVVDPKTGKKALRETNTMPQWAGSCWYYLRFADPHNEKEAWSKEIESYFLPVDLYVGGVEHAVLHLLYARFWHKVLYDLQLVSTKEPFLSLRNQGLVTAPSYKKPGGGYLAPSDVQMIGAKFYSSEGEELLVQSEKMSKSKLNGVSPDEMIEDFGADSLRLYEMFMGPFEREKVWSTEAVSGCHRFLTRFFTAVTSPKVSPEQGAQGMALAAKMAHFVRQATEAMEFNTAIARMMEFLNEFLPLPSYPLDGLKMAVQALYPFAPHIAEEMWHILGHGESLTYAPLLPIDPALLEEKVATYVIQVNGKLRGRFDLPKDQTEEALVALAKRHPEIAKHIQGAIEKVIFVPNRLLNFVIGP